MQRNGLTSEYNHIVTKFASYKHSEINITKLRSILKLEPHYINCFFFYRHFINLQSFP